MKNFTLQPTNVVISLLPGIKDFDMVINIKKEICQMPPDKGQMNVITETKVLNFIRLTPAKKYLITVQTPQLIELSLCLASRGLDLLDKKNSDF